MKNYNGTFLNHPLQPLKASREINGLTAIGVTAGKVRLDCPICGLAFERYACWAKRKKVCYCSKACADEAKRRPIEFVCVVCEAKIISIPAEVRRNGIATCSKACRSIHRRNLVTAGVLLNNPKRARRELGNGSARLTLEQVAEIATSAELTSILAAKYSVSATTIRKIRRDHRRSSEGT